MLHSHMERWRDYCTISRQTLAWKKIFCYVLRKVTISNALTRTDLPLSYSSRTLRADPSELSRFLATRYVMFCLYSGPLI